MMKPSFGRGPVQSDSYGLDNVQYRMKIMKLFSILLCRRQNIVICAQLCMRAGVCLCACVCSRKNIYGDSQKKQISIYLSFCSFLSCNSSYILFKILTYHINLINVTVYSHCLKLQGLDLVCVLV